MRSRSWVGKLWKRLRTSLVDDVPPALEGCEICRDLECTQARWESCERRLATEAARKAEKEAWEPAEVVKRPADSDDSVVRVDVGRKPTPVSS